MHFHTHYLEGPWHAVRPDLVIFFIFLVKNFPTKVVETLSDF